MERRGTDDDGGGSGDDGGSATNDDGAVTVTLTRRRYWPLVKYVASLAVVVVVVWVLSSHTDELSGVPGLFDHLRWGWVVPAVIAEVASFASLTVMQFKLLQAGGLDAPRSRCSR